MTGQRPDGAPRWPLDNPRPFGKGLRRKKRAPWRCADAPARPRRPSARHRPAGRRRAPAGTRRRARADDRGRHIAAERRGVALDVETIQGLGSETIETTTDWEWHEGPQTFTGVPLLAVLDAAGATGETITVTAMDEYAVTMLRADLEKHGALLATALNGKPLTEESFGPLWMIFPFDAMAEAAERNAYTDPLGLVCRPHRRRVAFAPARR